MEPTHENINNLRQALLDLHKLLLNYQQRLYEEKHGPVGQPAKLFELVLNNSEFEWLRRLSELIVGLDGLLEQDNASRAEEIKKFFLFASKLLIAQEEDNAFKRHYILALQTDPAVAIAHGKVKDFLDIG